MRSLLCKKKQNKFQSQKLNSASRCCNFYCPLVSAWRREPVRCCCWSLGSCVVLSQRKLTSYIYEKKIFLPLIQRVFSVWQLALINVDTEKASHELLPKAPPLKAENFLLWTCRVSEAAVQLWKFTYSFSVACHYINYLILGLSLQIEVPNNPSACRRPARTERKGRRQKIFSPISNDLATRRPASRLYTRGNTSSLI